MSRPLFSVITIAKNAETVIGETLRSVACQDFRNFEYLVIDGGSSDDTLSVVSRYHFPGMTVVSEKDKGIADAMNKGIRLGSGDLIVHMNAGDAFAAPDILQKVAADYRQSGWEWAVGSCELVTPRRGIVYERRIHAFDFDVLRRKQIICQQCTFVARTIFEKFGQFSEAFRVAMDYDFWLRIGQSVTPRILPFVVARVLLGGISSNPLRVNWELRRARIKNFGRSGGVLFEATEIFMQLALYMADKYATMPAYELMKRGRVYTAAREVIRRHYSDLSSALTTTIRKRS